MLPYTHITILVPIKRKTLLIINQLLTALITQFGGVTYSRFKTPITLNGMWRDPQSGKVVLDKICMVIVDADRASLGLDKYLVDLKAALEKDLNEDVVWILKHDVERVDS